MAAFMIRNGLLFWPGFERAWRTSDSKSVLWTTAFSWGICLALVGLFVWPEWLPYWFCSSLCVGLGITSLVTGTRSMLFGVSRVEGVSVDTDSNLRQAQSCYLRSEYFEAEKLLQQNLSFYEADIESALLLIAVYRRTARYEEALRWISQTQKREFSAVWNQVLQLEKEKCLRGKRQSVDLPPPKA